jgi:hypothetical protein
MYIFGRPIYKNLINNKRFFSLNTDNNLTVINNNLYAVNNNIKGVCYIVVTNLFVSVVSLFC